MVGRIDNVELVSSYQEPWLLRDLHVIAGVQNDDFSLPGDSGPVVLSSHDMKIVGMIVAGSYASYERGRKAIIDGLQVALEQLHVQRL